MELEVMKKLIRKYEPGHTRFSLRAMQAERYYRNETDILVKVKSEDEKKKEDSDNPLRNADNRIPRNFHGLIVNQKAAYMFTAPPLFDIGNEHGNEVVTEVLGDEYRKNTAGAGNQCVPGIQHCTEAQLQSVPPGLPAGTGAYEQSPAGTEPD